MIQVTKIVILLFIGVINMGYTSDTFLYYGIVEPCAIENERYIQSHTSDELKKVYKTLNINVKDIKCTKKKSDNRNTDDCSSTNTSKQCLMDQLAFDVSTVQECNLIETNFSKSMYEPYANGNMDVFKNMTLLNNKYLLLFLEGFHIVLKKNVTIAEDSNHTFFREDNKIYKILRDAIKNSEYQSVDKILMEHPNLINVSIDYTQKHKKTYYGDTALITAIEHSNIAMIRILVDKFKADVNQANITGYTPLIKSLFDAEETKYLIDKGANTNKSLPNCKTPLMFAASKTYLESVKILLNNKADAATKNYYGQNALYYIHTIFENRKGRKEKMEQIVDILVKHGASLYIKDDAGRTPLDYAEHLSSTVTKKILLKYMNNFPQSKQKAPIKEIIPKDFLKKE